MKIFQVRDAGAPKGQLSATFLNCTQQSAWVKSQSLRLKRPLRSSSPTTHPTPPCLLNHVPKCHIHTVFEPLQGWGLHHPPGQPGPMPDHSLSKEIFPNIQPKPPLTQLEAMASRPVAGYPGEETNTCPTTAPSGSCRELFFPQPTPFLSFPLSAEQLNT